MKREAVRIISTAMCAVIMLMAVCASGCWDMEEINKRTYVLGIGVDKGDKEGEYVFTMQTADSSPDAKGGVRCAVMQTATLAQALRRLDRAGAYDTTLVHLGCVVLGASVEGEDIAALLGYLFTSAQTRRQCVVAAADDSARELMEMKSDSSTAMQIATMLEKNDDALRQTSRLTLSSLKTALDGRGCFVMHRVALMEQKEQEPSSSDTVDATAKLRISGANVYSGGTFSGSMSEEETELARLFLDGQTSGIIAVAREGGAQFHYKINKSRCRTVCSVTNGVPMYEITVEVDCSLADWQGAEGGGTKPDRPQEEEIAQSLCGQLEALAQRSVNELGAAPLGLDREMRRQHWKWYEENSGSWAKLYKQAYIELWVMCRTS